MRLRPKLTIETIGGVPALESPWVRPLAAMGFHSNGRALIYDGLPGLRPRSHAHRFTQRCVRRHRPTLKRSPVHAVIYRCAARSTVGAMRRITSSAWPFAILIASRCENSTSRDTASL